MKATYQHFGKIVNGQKLYYNPKLLQQSLSDLEGKEFVEVLKEKYKKVSLDTHGYYRGGVVKECMGYEIFGGWEEDEIHAYFASMFLKHTVIRQLKKEDAIHHAQIDSIRSTASLSQAEMNEFIEKVVRWLSSEGIIIHSPEEYYLGRYKTQEE